MKASEPLGSEFHLAHQQGAVGRRQPVEGDAPPLRQQLPDLDVVALAGALLVGAHRVAVEQPRLARPLAERGGDAGLVGELGAVVGEHAGEDAPHAALPEQPEQAAQRPHGLGRRLRGHRQRELEPRRPVQQRQQHGGVPGAPLDRVHLPAAVPLVPRQRRERGVRPAVECGAALRGALLLRGL